MDLIFKENKFSKDIIIKVFLIENFDKIIEAYLPKNSALKM